MTYAPRTNYGLRDDQRSRRSSLGLTTGSFFHSTALIWLKIAVLAPMPSASVRMAVALKPGAFRISRKPSVTSCRSCSNHTGEIG